MPDREPAPAPGVERRFVPSGLRVERRAAAEGDEAGPKQIVGHASVFDQWTTLYEGRYWTWREVIRPGAYASAIAEKQDVRSLFNHDANFVLGRTKSGTLTLEEDAVGLLSRTTPPDTPTIRDLVLAPIERGDVSGMSFAWTPRKAAETVTTEGKDGSVTIDSGGLRITLRDDGNRTIEEWEVLSVNLYDVSPVTYPAYEGTDVSLEGMDVSLRSRAFRDFVAAKDRPRKRATPARDSYRRWLDGSATSPAGPR